MGAFGRVVVGALLLFVSFLQSSAACSWPRRLCRSAVASCQAVQNQPIGVGVSRGQLSSRGWGLQSAHLPRNSFQNLGGLCRDVVSGHSAHIFQLQQCKRSVHVEAGCWLPQEERTAGPCPGPHPTVRLSLSARVVPHPATWPLRKAVVLSKEGVQLILSLLCFQFSLPLIFPWKASLVKHFGRTTELDWSATSVSQIIEQPV